MPRAGALAIGAVATAGISPALGPAAIMLLAAGCLLAIGLVRSRGQTDRTRLLLAVLAGAALVAARQAPAALSGPSAAGGDLPDGRGPWTLAVEAVGSSRNGHQTATLASVATDPGAVPAPRPFRVAATLPGYPAVIPGDIVVVAGAIVAPPDSPYGAYLRRIGADGTLQATTMTARPAPDDPRRTLEGLRREAGSALAVVLPEPEAGLAAGILIGLRDLVDRDLAAAFTSAGVSHVVAISGWNIAIVAAAVGAFAGRLGRRRRSVVTFVAIIVYVVFAGASASVIRAGLMAAVVLLARETGRAGQAAAALGLAVTLLLVADPGLVRDAGLQLSALATAGLIAWATPLGGVLDRMGRGHLPGWLTENLAVSLAAQAATLPLILASFGRLSIVAPVVNLVVVPLVAPAMAAGLLAMGAGALVLAGAPAVVGSVLAAPGWVLLRAIVAIVDTAAGLPFASVSLAPPLDLLAAATTAALIVGVSAWARRRRRCEVPRPIGSSLQARAVAAEPPSPSGGAGRVRRPPAHRVAGRWTRPAVIALSVTILVAGAIVATRPAGVARITVLDVGQGDAILIEGSRGGRLLIDGGPDPARLLVVLDRRLPPWDRRLDAVVLSHPHEDHVAGLATLLDRYRVRQVFEPGTRGPGPGYAAWLDRLARPGAPERHSLTAGDRLSVDEIAMTVLWPIPGKAPLEPPDAGTGINNVSIVLLGSVGARRFLLAGDVEQDIDPSLLKAGLPRLDLLKVAHHGSRTATTQPFVDAVRPRVAIASAGTGNPYGHPTKQTIDRLRAAGATVYRTDLDGSVSATFTRDGMVMQTDGGRAADSAPSGRSGASATTLAPNGRSASAPPARTTALSTSASSAASSAAASAAAAFRCAIPVTALVPEREPVAAAPRPVAESGRSEPPDEGHPTTVGYHRPDDGTWAGGGRLPPALPGSPTLVRAARARRGRGRRIPGGPHGGSGDRRGPSACGGRGAPPRCRQGPPRRRSGASARPRRRLGSVADEARAP